MSYYHRVQELSEQMLVDIMYSMKWELFMRDMEEGNQ